MPIFGQFFAEIRLKSFKFWPNSNQNFQISSETGFGWFFTGIENSAEATTEEEDDVSAAAVGEADTGSQVAPFKWFEEVAVTTDEEDDDVMLAPVLDM